MRVLKSCLHYYRVSFRSATFLADVNDVDCDQFVLLEVTQTEMTHKLTPMEYHNMFLTIRYSTSPKKINEWNHLRFPGSTNKCINIINNHLVRTGHRIIHALGKANSLRFTAMCGHVKLCSYIMASNQQMMIY